MVMCRHTGMIDYAPGMCFTDSGCRQFCAIEKPGLCAGQEELRQKRRGNGEKNGLWNAYID